MKNNITTEDSTPLTVSSSSTVTFPHGISRLVVQAESSFSFGFAFAILLFSSIIFGELRIIFFDQSAILTFPYLFDLARFEGVIVIETQL